MLGSYQKEERNYIVTPWHIVLKTLKVRSYGRRLGAMMFLILIVKKSPKVWGVGTNNPSGRTLPSHGGLFFLRISMIAILTAAIPVLKGYAPRPVASIGFTHSYKKISSSSSKAESSALQSSI